MERVCSPGWSGYATGWSSLFSVLKLASLSSQWISPVSQDLWLARVVEAESAMQMLCRKSLNTQSRCDGKPLPVSGVKAELQQNLLQNWFLYAGFSKTRILSQTFCLYNPNPFCVLCFVSF